MTLNDEFVSLIKESMDCEDSLEEIISLDEDLTIPENLFIGAYLEETISALFPNGDLSIEIQKIYDMN
jgi:hypothetical protein